MLNLLKKEISLCLHPTAFLFLGLCALVFVPNYPYEVIFFFSCLSVFFCCIMSRENGDIAFSCTLPVKKTSIPLARIMTTVGLQWTILILTMGLGAVKEVVLPEEMIVNQAGISANLALIANGATLFGVFNLIFFPLYYKNPEKIGVPFVIGAVVVFVLIIAFIVLRWATPLYGVIFTGRNVQNTLAKVLALLFGICVYAAFTFASCRLSMKNFRKVDL